MQAAISNAVANDLLAIEAHLQARPRHSPSNLVAAVSWHAIGELYHVSQLSLFLWNRLLNPVLPAKHATLGASRPSLGTPRLRRPARACPPRDTSLDRFGWDRRECRGSGSSHPVPTRLEQRRIRGRNVRRGTPCVQGQMIG